MTVADGSWEAAARVQREAWARTTPEERLRWLDEALRFAAATGALARDREQRAEHARRFALGPLGPDEH